MSWKGEGGGIWFELGRHTYADDTHLVKLLLNVVGILAHTITKTATSMVRCSADRCAWERRRLRQPLRSISGVGWPACSSSPAVGRYIRARGGAGLREQPPVEVKVRAFFEIKKRIARWSSEIRRELRLKRAVLSLRSNRAGYIWRAQFFSVSSRQMRPAVKGGCTHS